jgi:hypothetical protein
VITMRLAILPVTERFLIARAPKVLRSLMMWIRRAPIDDDSPY